jgi:hypothetical protein
MRSVAACATFHEAQGLVANVRLMPMPIAPNNYLVLATGKFDWTNGAGAAGLDRQFMLLAAAQLPGVTLDFQGGLVALACGVRQADALNASGRGESGDIFTRDRVYRPPPLTVPTFANSWCKPRADIPTRNQVSAPVIAKKQPYCSNGAPAEIAWRGRYEGVSRVFVLLARRDGENARTRVKRVK